MIIVDIETSGLDEYKHGIVELAAIKFESPEICFKSASRLDKGDEIDPIAMKINGLSEEEMRDRKRVSQKEMLINFFDWVVKENDFFIAGENAGSFDLKFINRKAVKYGIRCPLQYRALDLQSVAQTRYFQIYKKLFIKDGKSKMGLPACLEFVGLRDDREEHKALECCELEAECLSRLLYGKGLFNKYSKFKMPDYLRTNDNL